MRYFAKISALLLSILIIFTSLSACKKDGKSTKDDVLTWACGATSQDKVTAEFQEGMLNIRGKGKIADYENAEKTPWSKYAKKIKQVFIDDYVYCIGKNAFAGLGKNEDGIEVFFGNGIETIGESAFEGTRFSEYTRLDLPTTVTEIRSRAFSKCEVKSVGFLAQPKTIAEDIFKDTKTTVYALSGSFSDDAKLQYGGTLEYKLLYSLYIKEDYGTDEVSGEGTVYVPEGEEYTQETLPADEEYVFTSWEIISGEISIEPTNPDFEVTLSGNVSLIAHFNKK